MVYYRGFQYLKEISDRQSYLLKYCDQTIEILLELVCLATLFLQNWNKSVFNTIIFLPFDNNQMCVNYLKIVNSQPVHRILVYKLQKVFSRQREV